MKHDQYPDDWKQFLKISLHFSFVNDPRFVSYFLLLSKVFLADGKKMVSISDFFVIVDFAGIAHNYK